MVELLSQANKHEAVRLRLVPCFPVALDQETHADPEKDRSNLGLVETRQLLESVNRAIRQYPEREVPYLTVRRIDRTSVS